LNKSKQFFAEVVFAEVVFAEVMPHFWMTIFSRRRPLVSGSANKARTFSRRMNGYKSILKRVLPFLTEADF
jgi:hypothetical protein